MNDKFFRFEDDHGDIVYINPEKITHLRKDSKTTTTIGLVKSWISEITVKGTPDEVAKEFSENQKKI